MNKYKNKTKTETKTITKQFMNKIIVDFSGSKNYLTCSAKIK